MNEQKNKNFTINENGSIVVHNYCAAELPKITVTIHSGQTTYRFNGSYDGTRSLPAKVFEHMVLSSTLGAPNHSYISQIK